MRLGERDVSTKWLCKIFEEAIYGGPTFVIIVTVM